jgi:plasmid stabilization system protein ParE
MMDLYQIFFAGLVIYFLLKAASHLVVASRNGLPGQDEAAQRAYEARQQAEQQRRAREAAFEAAFREAFRNATGGGDWPPRGSSSARAHEDGGADWPYTEKRTPSGWQGSSVRRQSRHVPRRADDLDVPGIDIEDATWEDLD